MKAVVFTESSNTVDENAQSLLNYYKGQFRPVASLVEELSNFADTDLYILSDEFGVSQASQSISGLTPGSDRAQVHEHAQSLLLKEVEDADIIILLLTKSVFTEILKPIWSDLIKKSTEDSIWGLAVPQSVLDELDLNSLRTKGTLYIYPRVGVARIDTETRTSILDAVEARTNSN
ncbi:hypothetical protein ACFQJD_02320 [Haloplanus sp. GCM10025708]|uniref:hypothetical protein n=1 Tax=Haloferacaceae TaxID=1644056 RepID=UPI0036145EEE